MARKRLGPERQQWKGIDANERAFGTVRNALVAIALEGVAGVSPEIPGEGRRMISPEDADRYIAKGRQVLADFESQEMAPGGARGRAQKWMDRTIDELRRFVTDAEAVRSGKKPQKMTPESYGELRKSLGVGETGKPVDRWWHALPPGVESKIDCSDAKAMVDYRPYQGTPYDVSRSSSGAIEVCFASLKEARRFFDQAVSSGHIESAELREDAKGHPRGRLIDEFNDNPIVGEARRYPQPKLPPRQFVAPRVRDFNTLDDLIRHARDELGATHVSFEHGTHGNVIYFPRKDGQYEAASTWQKAGYWHAQGPGSREIVRHLPGEAQAIGGGATRTAEAPRGRRQAFSIGQPVWTTMGVRRSGHVIRGPIPRDQWSDGTYRAPEQHERAEAVWVQWSDGTKGWSFARHLAPVGEGRVAEAPRAPRGRRAPTEWTTDNTEISTWFERDRASVVLNTLDGTTIIEWWDDDVHEAVQDGFLNPRDWHGSAVEYANQMGAQPQAGVREAPRSTHRSPERAPGARRRARTRR
jgi:hypothetical protein